MQATLEQAKHMTTFVFTMAEERAKKFLGEIKEAQGLENFMEKIADVDDNETIISESEFTSRFYQELENVQLKLSPIHCAESLVRGYENSTNIAKELTTNIMETMFVCEHKELPFEESFQKTVENHNKLIEMIKKSMLVLL